MTKAHAHPHRPIKPAQADWTESDPSIVPVPIQMALRRAMQLEEVSVSEFDDLLWILAQTSAGERYARDATSTARGLFQLSRAQYALNPNGEHSFGDPVEECQGGIHYILGRYYRAAAAKRFWLANQWC